MVFFLVVIIIIIMGSDSVHFCICLNTECYISRSESLIEVFITTFLFPLFQFSGIQPHSQSVSQSPPNADWLSWLQLVSLMHRKPENSELTRPLTSKWLTLPTPLKGSGFLHAPANHPPSPTPISITVGLAEHVQY